LPAILTISTTCIIFRPEEGNGTAEQETGNMGATPSTTRKTLLSAAIILLALVAIVGCSKRSRFASTLSKADRVILKTFAGTNGPVEVELTRSETKELAEALRQARIYGDAAADFATGAKAEFFRGTNSLAVITIERDIFWTEEGELLDETGSIRSLYNRLHVSSPPDDFRVP